MLIRLRPLRRQRDERRRLRWEEDSPSERSSSSVDSASELVWSDCVWMSYTWRACSVAGPGRVSSDV